MNPSTALRNMPDWVSSSRALESTSEAARPVAVAALVTPPMWALISAYERLIRGRGREIGPEAPALPAVAHATPQDAIRPDKPAEGADN